MKIHVIDDDASLTRALTELLHSIGYEAVIHANAAAFLSSSATRGPGCVIADVRLPGMSGLELQSELGRRDIRLPIIFITGHGDIRMAVQAMKAGAVDFLEKPFRPQELLDAVATAVDVDKSWRADGARLGRLRERYASLTPREREVMRLVCAGLTSKQIATELSVREITIKVHRGSLMRKMGARSVAQLAEMATILEFATSARKGVSYTFV